MSVLKYPARCERQSWQAGGAAVHMSAASVESGRMKSAMSVQMPERLGGLRPSVLSQRPV